MTDRPDPDGERRPLLRVVGPDGGPDPGPPAASGAASAVGSEPAIEVPSGAAVEVTDPPGGRRAAGDEHDEPEPDPRPDSGPGDGSEGADPEDGERDWAWVAEWRESDEPTPWATGLPLAAFAAVLAGVAVWVLSAGLADRPLLAVVLNLLVAGGLVPAMWLSRNLPVLRWFAAGAAVGVVGGWVAALSML